MQNRLDLRSRNFTVFGGELKFFLGGALFGVQVREKVSWVVLLGVGRAADSPESPRDR